VPPSMGPSRGDTPVTSGVTELSVVTELTDRGLLVVGSFKLSRLLSESAGATLRLGPVW